MAGAASQRTKRFNGETHTNSHSKIPRRQKAGSSASESASEADQRNLEGWRWANVSTLVTERMAEIGPTVLIHSVIMIDHSKVDGFLSVK